MVFVVWHRVCLYVIRGFEIEIPESNGDRKMEEPVSQKTHEIVGYIIAGVLLGFMFISSMS